MIAIGLFVLFWLRLTTLRPYGFTRGRSPRGDERGTFYSCEKFATCREAPVPESEFHEWNLQYCSTHGAPMNVPVHQESA